jgi:thrombospondin motif-containing protein 7/thrombospondin motif-containing protein 12
VKDHKPEEDGQHLHIIYKKSIENKNKRSCATSDDWETAWSNRLASENRLRALDTGVNGNSVHKRPTCHDLHSQDGGFVEDTTNYLETLVVADKKFLQARNGTDYEQYLFTAVNMASDILHDDTVGRQLDLVLVRVIFLEKEEEEFDLIINRDADSTLTSFCEWSTRLNPVVTHPNHHDIAILFTKHDICAGEDDCGTVGLANVAGCCGKDVSCAICEDTGLVVGTVMAHETGHLLGCNHDSDEDNPPAGECPAKVGDYNIHVMASWSQVSPANWSICSRKFIDEYFDNGLGECLLDEPQDHDFKLPQMPPGVIYDREWQCIDYYGPTKPCNLSPDRSCKQLSCAPSGYGRCRSKGPPADGTSCGANKWCFGGECVEIGTRPGAINGEWGEWGSWSECSRTCGGGTSYVERQCDNPRPSNNGRYCVGKRRRYRLCNVEPCDENTLTFREVQCKEHDKDDDKWAPFNDGKPEHVCALVCVNSDHVFQVMKRRVKDGTPCKRGTKNKCIAGKCRKVGCDMVFDSDAVEDICGVCDGDTSTCEIVDEVYKEKGRSYQKVVTIPAGSRSITVEETKPSKNFLALSAPNGTFYLNGNYKIDPEGETKIAGSVSVYTNEESNKERLAIAGPIKEDVIVYILNDGDTNPGIHYRYSNPSKPSSYQPKFGWELTEWSPCNVFCGGGTQLSEPTCIEERGGKVSNKHCKQIPKPDPSTQVCNEQACKIKWRTGKWGKCNGCIDKPGYKYRVVNCVKQSPFEDSEVYVEEDECKTQKPSNKESCTSDEPCADMSSKRKVSLEVELGADEDNLLRDRTSSNFRQREPKSIANDNCKEKCNKDERCGDEIEEDSRKRRGWNRKEKTSRKTIIRAEINEGKSEPSSRKNGLAVDKVNPKRFKHIEIPMTYDADDFDMSEEALEFMGDKVSSDIDSKKIKEFLGDDAQRRVQQSKKENEENDDNEEDNDYAY